MRIFSEIGVAFLKEWIRHHSNGMSGIVEMGAGSFDKLAYAHPDCQLKAGIEIYEPTLQAAVVPGVQKILGDFRQWRSYIDPVEFPCVMFIDALEHIPMDDAVKVIRECQAAFRRILLFVPEGDHPQGTTDGNEYQTHQSTWSANDVQALEFHLILIYPFFHNDPKKSKGAIFARWDNK